ncbi:hypothetical protein DXG01_009419 [Tephrocybe rancida]|nr:hypothetical protein DXG01_009419 [Tephrocybe rancida]
MQGSANNDSLTAVSASPSREIQVESVWASKLEKIVTTTADDDEEYMTIYSDFPGLETGYLTEGIGRGWSPRPTPMSPSTAEGLGRGPDFVGGFVTGLRRIPRAVLKHRSFGEERKSTLSIERTATNGTDRTTGNTLPFYVSNPSTPIAGASHTESIEMPVIEPSFIHELKFIFRDQELFKRLVGCQALDAQLILNSFQQLLDNIDLDLPFRKDLTNAMQRLSSKAGLAPTCYMLEGVTQIGQDPVAAGGFSDVYKGNFRDRVVRLKTVRLYKARHIDHLLKKLWKEVILWGQLSDPNVLTIYGLYLYKKRVYIVSPWMENEGIREYLERHPDAPRVRLALDVGSGLSYLHNNDIIHGDLKTPNVLVDDAGRARLADFGLSAILDASIPHGDAARWRAPEMLQDTGKNSEKSDVYSWGCVALEIFTGQIPFHGFANDTVTFHVVSGACPVRPNPSSPSWKIFGLTEEIWACMEQCWEREPLRRPSASTVVNHLNDNTTTADPRQSPEANRLSPSEFRRQMNRGHKVITIKELKHILENLAICNLLSLDERKVRYRMLRYSIRIRQAKATTFKSFKSEPAKSDPGRLKELRKISAEIQKIRHEISDLKVPLIFKFQVFFEDLPLLDLTPVKLRFSGS